MAEEKVCLHFLFCHSLSAGKADDSRLQGQGDAQETVKLVDGLPCLAW